MSPSRFTPTAPVCSTSTRVGSPPSGDDPSDMTPMTATRHDRDSLTRNRAHVAADQFRRDAEFFAEWSPMR